MSYKIKREDGFITLELTKEKTFDIQTDHFKVTRNFNGLANCCDLFIHTKQTKKNWVEDDLFCDLALIINEEFPDHEIDWINTFIAIEQENYSTHLIKEDDKEDGVDVFENTDTVFGSVEIQNEEFSKPEVRSGFKEQVVEKLKKKGIIK